MEGEKFYEKSIRLTKQDLQAFFARQNGTLQTTFDSFFKQKPKDEQMMERFEDLSDKLGKVQTPKELGQLSPSLGEFLWDHYTSEVHPSEVKKQLKLTNLSGIPIHIDRIDMLFDGQEVDDVESLVPPSFLENGGTLVQDPSWLSRDRPLDNEKSHRIFQLKCDDVRCMSRDVTEEVNEFLSRFSLRVHHDGDTETTINRVYWDDHKTDQHFE